MLSARSWWLKSRVLLWSRASSSYIYFNTSQTRMFERTDASRCRIHRRPFSRSFRPSIHHLSTNSGVAYSWMPDDGLPAYSTTAPSRPAQQTPHILRSSSAYLVFQIYFQPELQPHSAESCHIWLVQLSRVRPLHFSQKIQRGIDDTEPVQTVWVRRHRGSLLMRCQLRNSSYSFNQR